MAKITVALMRELEKRVNSGEISYTRMIEILNEQAKLNQDTKFEYYKTKASKVNYKGERYFKFKWDSNKVLTVCLDTENETKKGKGHFIGIYWINRVTMFTNWYPIYVEPCTENEFNIAFEKAIGLLK